MHLFLRFTLFFQLLIGSLSMAAQKVGVVLSGGGARAAAHVGFLKALEEEGIPIDYIAGTSMGAIVGGMYASGYTPAEMDSIMRSDDYIRMARGDISEELRFYFKEHDVDAGMGTVKLSRQNLISSTIPTNLVDATASDYAFMVGYGPAAAAANYNFDDLFIPFRCVAADVGKKEAVVFRNGDLATAIRASMTYPFYVAPIKVDGRLLFDGGLYNNFPSDVLYEDFLPDVILGSNVSSNSIEPIEDDLFSQFKSMVVYETNFETLCDQMFIVEHELDVSTFDFANIGEAIDAGYAMAMAQMDSIKATTDRRISQEERTAKRAAFRAKWKAMQFDEITVSGLDRAQRNYVRKFIDRKESVIDGNRLRTEYFRVAADDKIRSVYPTATLKENGFYRMNMDLRREKDLLLTVGGNFSSRPVNMGYINARYNLFGSVSSTLNVNSYFGKFYGSTHVSVRMDFPASVPISVEPFITLNRWDYFRSFATFFEEVRPSYIVVNERFAGMRVRFPMNNKGRLDFIGNAAQISDDYYRSETFLATDTADRTRFNAAIFDLIYERNTLNRKAYANSGTFLRIQGKYTNGSEYTIPGSTQVLRDTTRSFRQWVMLKGSYTNYFSRLGPFKTGVLMEAVISNQPLFQTAKASQIAAQPFQPIAESSTFFMPQFRAFNYAAGGFMLVTSFTPFLDLRMEGYAFASTDRIRDNQTGRPQLDFRIKPLYMASGMLVFHSPVGPLSIAANYYDLKEAPWSIIFNFGYLIFNRSVRHN